MNQKAYSVLFCALLASSFVHELRAKGVVPVGSHRSGLLERVASNEICELKCALDLPTGSIGLSVQAIGDILVISNVAENAALLIDVPDQLIVLLNGSKGGGVAIDLSSQSGVYIKSGLWEASKGSLDSFIKSLSGGLKSILSIPEAEKLSLDSVAENVLKEVNEIITKLLSNIKEELEHDPKVGLEVIIGISKPLVKVLSGPLKGLLPIIGNVALKITHDVAGLLHVLQGLETIITKLGGSLKDLIEKGVKLDLKPILGASDGLEALINLILQIGPKINFAKILKDILESPEKLFKLIAQLGGNVAFGITGLFLIIAKIVGFIQKNVNLEHVISDIIEFVAYAKEHKYSDLGQALKATLQGLLRTLEHFKASPALKGLVKLVKDLIQEKLEIGGVKISEIIKKIVNGLKSGQGSLLTLIVGVLLHLKPIAEVEKLVPSLLLVLILKLNSPSGIKQLLALGIQIDVSKLAGGLLKNVLGGVGSLLEGLVRGDFFEVLAKLPVIGAVITALNAALVTSTGGKIALNTLLNGASTVKNLITGLIQHILETDLGVSPEVLEKVKSLVECTSSPMAHIHLDNGGSEEKNGEKSR